MILLEKWMTLTPLQKLPKNVGDLGKIIVATSFEKMPKVQKIAQSGHTGGEAKMINNIDFLLIVLKRWNENKEEKEPGNGPFKKKFGLDIKERGRQWDQLTRLCFQYLTI